MKFALWALVIGLVVLWLMRPKNTSIHKNRTAADNSQLSDAAEQMVQCGRCGTFVPASEAVVGAQAMFCCEEHRRQHGSA